MNFLTERELKGLASDGIDTTAWLVVGLLIGYSLSSGSWWQKAVTILLVSAGFTFLVTQIARLIDLQLEKVGRYLGKRQVARFNRKYGPR